MPDPTPAVTPVAPVIPTVTSDPTITSVPLTSQTAPATTPPPTTKPAGPTLEVTHAAESFAALNALFDQATGTPPATTAPTTPGDAPAPPATPVGADDFQKRLDGITAPPGAHPNLTAGIEQAKALATAERTRAEQLETKVKDYEAKVQEFEKSKAEGKLPEAVEKELKELRGMQREIDFRNDPEFKKNYVEPINKGQSEIMGLLKQAGMKPDIEKFINDNGGIVALSQSQEKAGLKGNPDMTMAEWVDQLLIGSTVSQFKGRIQNKLSGILDTIDRGRNELQDFRANSEQRMQSRMKQLSEEFNAGRDGVMQKLGDLAKPITISATMTPEERVSAEAHNNLLRQSGEKFDNYLKVSKDPKIAGEILAKATQADMLMIMRTKDQATIKELQDKLTGIKSAGSHSQAGDRVTPGTDKPSLSDLLKQPTDKAMNDLFNTAGVTR